MSVFYNNALIGASGQATSAYQISRSLRFNSADSAYLSRTFGTPTTQNTFTFSAWVKRATLSSAQTLFGVSTNHSFGFTSGDALNLTFGGTSALTTTALFRDTSAWYHIVWSQSGTSHTVYVNNTSVGTATATSSVFNTAVAHQIAAGNTTNFFPGYLADAYFIDGQALTPTSFGQFDTNNIWQPKAYSGTYGTNGFKLDFADNSTAAALGYDAAGSNDWTVNNLSVTAGAGNDSLVDSPTNYGTDTGAGGEVRGNYCTFDPRAFSNAGTVNWTLANGNLDAGDPDSCYGVVPGTIGVSSGKYYWELTFAGGSIGSTDYWGIERCDNRGRTRFPGNYENAYWFRADGNKASGTGAASSYGSSFALTDKAGIAFDADNGTLTFYKNGVSLGTAFTGIDTSQPWRLVIGNSANATSITTWTLNTGQRPFIHAAPSGFKALCTQNLPTPTITKPSTVMDVVTYTGTGSTLTPTSTLGFSPDLVWIKSRSAATDHALYDAVRGAQARLESNNTDAEVTSDNGLTAFNSNGFTLGTLAQVNTNAETYAGWCWDAGSSTVTNTAGSITSQVRANASAGFSVVTFTGTGANATIGHGLGVAPQMVIVKRRDTTGDWAVWHTGIAATNYLLLNSTAASTSGATYWNSASPTSTIFSVGTATNTNANTGTYVSYCFAPVASYSAFGIYTGNGSTDGPMVYTNMRPRWIMLKRTNTTGNWTIIDTAREGYNVDNDPLYPNLVDAEGTTDLADILSNGFKLRSTDASVNANASTYIYACFAESPFALARAR